MFRWGDHKTLWNFNLFREISLLILLISRNFEFMQFCEIAQNLYKLLEKIRENNRRNSRTFYQFSFAEISWPPYCIFLLYGAVRKCLVKNGD